MQYSISNLNAFILLVTIAYTLFVYINNNKQYEHLQDKDNSPIQFINQIKGYFYINPMLALSLAITLFSFIGIPPLIGFFAKQIVLSAALNNGYVFISLIAIITSVISAVYYLAIIKQIFFNKPEYEINSSIDKLSSPCVVNNESTHRNIKVNNIIISSSLSVVISVLTLIMLLFIFTPQE
jgi:NADH-ubiquinone oxidoreductase chain 2